MEQRNNMQNSQYQDELRNLVDSKVISEKTAQIHLSRVNSVSDKPTDVVKAATRNPRFGFVGIKLVLMVVAAIIAGYLLFRIIF